MPTAMAIDIGLVTLFGLQHSLMARPAFKRWWTRIVPEPLERSIYVLLASLALIVLFWFWRPIPAPVWTFDNPTIALTAWIIFAIGWSIVLVSTFLINHFELFGLSQVWRHARRAPAQAPVFRTPLFYKQVRHPIYSGFLLAFWSIPAMTAGHLVLAVTMSLYILIGVAHEERDLITQFGESYERYRGRVGKLAPRLWRPDA